jgi:hypothetical protein
MGICEVLFEIQARRDSVEAWDLLERCENAKVNNSENH